MNKIKVVIKNPGTKPYTTWISDTLENLQRTVEGPIETVTVARDVVIICNEEGPIKRLPFNCKVFGQAYVGTIIFAGIEGDEFASLPCKIASWCEDQGIHPEEKEEPV